MAVPEGDPHVKICGVTRVDDALLAAELGAWAVGLIFHRPSPRSCPPEVAVEIGAALRRQVEVAGVFVNAPLDDVARTADEAGLTLLQLHGDEGPAYCGEAARRTGCRVVKAARVRTQADVRALEAYRVDFHMLDNHARGLPGGTGETFDWELARAGRGSIPIVLSGGLTPENVGEAIAAVGPFAVDVASGVESEPGRKDRRRLRAFFAAVHGGADRPALAS